MTHNIGDMVASYLDARLTKIEVGWVAEIVDEIIWIAHVEHVEPRYKVQWTNDNGISIFLHTEEDIKDMKNLYKQWHKI